MRIVLDDEHAVQLAMSAHALPPAIGQVSTNSAPCPTPSLCALTRPPASCMNRLTMKRPKPCAVIAAAAARMQARELLEQPRTGRRTGSRRRCRAPRARLRRSTRRASSVIVPPPTGATAAMAFSRRLRTTTSMASGSASTSQPARHLRGDGDAIVACALLELADTRATAAASSHGLAFEIHATALRDARCPESARPSSPCARGPTACDR